MGSAVNDTVQQVGQALSVAVLGSVLSAAYTAAMPADVAAPARDSLGDALRVAAQTGDAGLATLAREAFVQAMSCRPWSASSGRWRPRWSRSPSCSDRTGHTDR